MREISIRIMVMGTALMSLSVSAGWAQEKEPEAADDVMRPTRFPLRLTPEIARGISRNWLGDTLSSMSDQQRSRLVDAVAGRVMQLGHENGPVLESFSEFFAEFRIAGFGQATPKYGKRFGERSKEIVPLIREFHKHVADAAEPLLSVEQMAQMKKRLGKEDKDLERFERKMARWAEGNADKWENFLEPHPKDELESERKKEQPEEIQQAKWYANYMVEQFGPKDWKMFLRASNYFFEMDEEQQAQGNTLLAEYIEKARAIMTDQWNQQIRRNRVEFSFCWLLREKKEPVRPWMHRLNVQFEELARPVRELGRAFRRDVLALLSDEQRQAALLRTKTLATKHGLAAEEQDAALLGLEK